MLTSIVSSSVFPLISIAAMAGVVGGIMAGLLGVGGGIVIVPALYLALSYGDGDPALIMQVAVGTSLATIVFTSLSSSWGHYRKGSLDPALLRRWAPSIVLGVISGALLGGFVSGFFLLAVFATIAMLVSAEMILRQVKDSPEPRDFSNKTWAATGFGAGAISAMMGIGGGTVCVPLLGYLGYDIRRAVGTSAAIGCLIGLPGAVIYMATGFGQAGLPPFSFGYVNLLAAGIIIPLSASFAQVGVKLAHSIPRRALRLTFGIFLLLTSLRMFADLGAALL